MELDTSRDMINPDQNVTISKSTPAKRREKRRIPFDEHMEILVGFIDSDNIAADLAESETEDGKQVLATIGRTAYDEYVIDKVSRAEWEERYIHAQRLGMVKPREKTKNFPWANASNVVFPLVLQAVIQFQSRASGTIIRDGQMVKCRTQGKADDAKRARATRVQNYMSYQFSEEMEEWASETDILMGQISLMGCGFKKVWRDMAEDVNRDEFVPAWNLVVNYNTKNFERCPRYTHVYELYPNEIDSKIASGEFLHHDYMTPVQTEADAGGPLDTTERPKTPDPNDTQAPAMYGEQYRWWDLDGDGMEEPYIVTFHMGTTDVVRIVARYELDGVVLSPDGPGGRRVVKFKPTKYFEKFPFIPSPDGGIYDMGFGMFLGPFADAATAMLNQLIDAGTDENAGGGFLGGNLDIRGNDGSNTIQKEPGVFKRIAASGADLRNNIVEYPSHQPSKTLFECMVFLVTTGKELSNSLDAITGNSSLANVSPTVMLTVVEQGLKTITAAIKRVFRSMKREYRMVYRLNSRHLEDEKYFTFQDEEMVIAREDFAMGDMDIVPVADPEDISDAVKLMRAEALMAQLGKGFNDAVIRRKYAEALNVDDVEALLDAEAPPDPEMLKLELEKRKLDIEDRRVKIEERKELAEKMKILADANLSTAKAEAAEAGIQTEQYQADLAALIDLVDAIQRGDEGAIRQLEMVRKGMIDEQKANAETGGGAPGAGGGKSSANSDRNKSSDQNNNPSRGTGNEGRTAPVGDASGRSSVSGASAGNGGGAGADGGDGFQPSIKFD